MGQPFARPPHFLAHSWQQVAAASDATLPAMAREGGVLAWDAPRGVAIRGAWERRTASGFWGLFNFNYLLAPARQDAAVTFTLPIRQPGHYDVRINFPAHANRAANARIEVLHADGTAVERVDMRTFGYGRLLGRYRFASDRPAQVVISTGQADGWIAVEGIGFVRRPDAPGPATEDHNAHQKEQEHDRTETP